MHTLFLVLLIALGLLHLGIAGLEMLGRPATQAKAFDMPLAFVQQPEARVALLNQGIYNAGLGLLLLLAALLPAGWAMQMALVGLVLLVGLVGGFTATRKIFAIQCLPALIILIVGLIAR